MSNQGLIQPAKSPLPNARRSSLGGWGGLISSNQRPSTLSCAMSCALCLQSWFQLACCQQPDCCTPDSSGGGQWRRQHHQAVGYDGANEEDRYQENENGALVLHPPSTGMTRYKRREKEVQCYGVRLFGLAENPAFFHSQAFPF